MKVIEEQILVAELKEIAAATFGDLVKGVVDVEQETLALDAELHADLEALLLENGSRQENLWGINFYPELFGSDDFIEFDSMINMRPSQKNMTRGVEDPQTRKKILEIVQKRIQL